MINDWSLGIDSTNTMDKDRELTWRESQENLKGLRSSKDGKKKVQMNKDVDDNTRRDRSESFYSTETGSTSHNI